MNTIPPPTKGADTIHLFFIFVLSFECYLVCFLFVFCQLAFNVLEV